MESKKIDVLAWMTLSGLFLFVVTVDAACKQCSAVSHAACLNETAFAVCFDDSTQSTHIGTCRTGYVCTTTAGVCKLRSETSPDCGICGVCTKGFACQSKSTFEYCSGTTLTGIKGKCPSGQYCSITSVIQTRNICKASCNTEPTCYAADEE